jgi:hypothetical protein
MGVDENAVSEPFVDLFGRDDIGPDASYLLDFVGDAIVFGGLTAEFISRQIKSLLELQPRLNRRRHRQTGMMAPLGDDPGHFRRHAERQGNTPLAQHCNVRAVRDKFLCKGRGESKERDHERNGETN